MEDYEINRFLTEIQKKIKTDITFINQEENINMLLMEAKKNFEEIQELEKARNDVNFNAQEEKEMFESLESIVNFSKSLSEVYIEHIKGNINLPKEMLEKFDQFIKNSEEIINSETDDLEENDF